MEDKNYSANPNTGIDSRKATVYGAELQRLTASYNGMLSADEVVKEAARRSSPLHDYFDWDDSEAGRNWRRHQARLLLASIRIEVKEAPEPIHLFKNVKISGGEGRAYVPTVEALASDEYRQQIMTQLYARLSSINKELRLYREFGKVSEQIELLSTEFANA